jgi:hypothetical protein
VCQFAAQPPPAKRQRRGTPKDSRTLTRFGQAVWAAVVPRPHHLRRAGPRHGITRATTYRYRGEVIIALAEQSPQLSEALDGPQTRAFHM